MFSMQAHAQFVQNPKPVVVQSILLRKQETHRPNLIITYKPHILPVKFTFKTGVNHNQTDKINWKDLQTGDVNDAFDDVDFMNIGRYDARCKIYVKRKARIVLRALIQPPNNYYIIGLQFKM